MASFIAIKAVTNAIRETFKRNLYYAEILKGTTE